MFQYGIKVQVVKNAIVEKRFAFVSLLEKMRKIVEFDMIRPPFFE